MRLSLATAACAVSVALLAGCSTSPQGSLPASGPSQTSASRSGGSHFQAPAKMLTREQAKNLHPNVFPGKLLQQLAKRKYSRPVHIATGGSVQEWVMDDGGYIWGLKHAHKVVAYMTDCSGAEGGVVDHSGRLVVACTNTGTVNIYNAGNTTGPADVVLNEDTNGYSYPAAAFEDNSGNIYVTNLYNYTNCDPYCYFSPGNVAYWLSSNQANGAPPSGTYQDPNLYEDYFGDVDASGNVYLDGFNNSFVPEVDKVSQPHQQPVGHEPQHQPGIPGRRLCREPDRNGRAFSPRPGRVRIGLGCPLHLLAAGSEPAHHGQAEAEYREPLRPGLRRIQ